MKFRYDVVNAVMARDTMVGTSIKIQKAEAVAKLVESGMAEPLAALHKRLSNIMRRIASAAPSRR